ncbi:MAG: efflux RND transporter periplasmic adaptor subunit [Deltaproteobacteria bacterium]|nr:efflux RND transporter periplasmic adaptor subunit [Deltaproteobacteria bacterium]
MLRFLSPTPHLLTALAMCLTASLSACKKPEAARPLLGPAQDNTPVSVRGVAVVARTQAASYALTGTLIADQQSQLTPLVGGRVERVLVERGAHVTAGQPLLRLRDVDYRSSAENAQASLAQARARLGEAATGRDPEQMPEVQAARANSELAADMLRRTEQLAGNGSVSDQELQRARANAAAAAAQYSGALNGSRGAIAALRSARVAVAQTSRSIADSIVRAPFAGEIAERFVNVGEYVTPQRAVVTLVRTNPLRIELQVPQERIAVFQQGQQVHLRVDAFPDREFTGEIRYISAAVRADTRALIAEAVVPNDDGALRPGLFATARVDLSRQETIFEVPADAVVSSAGVHRVYVIGEDHRVQERVITIRSRTTERVTVDQGLANNERVALGRLDRLSDGALITE